jgi:uncharacterized membrane protein (DUF106 family)
MSILNSVLRKVFDLLLSPFRDLPWWVSLTLISLIASVGMLWVFKKTSDQVALENVKRQIHACLFEIRLFNDDLGAILRSQVGILRHNLTYFRLSLAPMLWMILPFVLVVAQLQFHYGYEALNPGKKALVKVELSESAGDFEQDKPPLSLESSPGFRVETAGVWVPAKREMTWRVVALADGAHDLKVKFADQAFPKSALVGGGIVRRSPLRVQKSLLRELIYPAERPLPKSGPIRSISLQYPPDPEIMGMPGWLMIFLVLSIVFAFALRKRLGVTV